VGVNCVGFESVYALSSVELTNQGIATNRLSLPSLPSLCGYFSAADCHTPGLPVADSVQKTR